MVTSRESSRVRATVRGSGQRELQSLWRGHERTATRPRPKGCGTIRRTANAPKVDRHETRGGRPPRVYFFVLAARLSMLRRDKSYFAGRGGTGSLRRPANEATSM